MINGGGLAIELRPIGTDGTEIVSFFMIRFVRPGVFAQWV